MEIDYRYKAICHTKCFWLDTLWEVGETYEGDIEPGKHFSESGKPDADLPPMDAGKDPRSTNELKEILYKAGFDVPEEWTRKQVWKKLTDAENAISKDELTNPSGASKQIKRKKTEMKDGNAGKHMQPGA